MEDSMTLNNNTDCNKVFDEIIKSRQSIRSFKDDIPSKENIEDILEAGMLAPYAAQAVGENEDFRRFFVFENGSNSMEIARILMYKKAEQGLDHFKKMVEEKPFLKGKVQSFMDKLQMIVDKGVIGVGTAPYFIVVAELRGVPPVEMESIAHCLENMWLKATELELGFGLVSLTSQMAEEEEFMKLLGMPVGKYGINGCAIGYPAAQIPHKSRPDTKKATKWMK
jgi:nitroreductase